MDRVLIVGASNTGRELSERLADRHQVVLLDSSDENIERYGKPIKPEEVAATLKEERGLWPVRGDGSSRIVLQHMFDTELKCGLVAAAGEDQTNLEVGRLGKEIGFEPVIAIQHDTAHREEYQTAQITALDRTQLLAGQVEHSLSYKGAVVPTGVGLGLGELVEVRLVRTSPILGRPLKNLAPHRWRIAAIFRKQDLVVPTGETTLEIDDRVLLVGDPRILQTVTEYLRMGTPQFPMPYGPNVVTLEFGGPDEKLWKEAEDLARGCGVPNLIRGLPGAEDSGPVAEPDFLTCKEGEQEFDCGTFGLPSLQEPGFRSKTSVQRPGVVVVRSRPRSWHTRLLGIRGLDAELCDRVLPPVLFARGSHPFKKILLPVSDSDLNLHSAEMAIDITRQLNASLTAINVDLPRYISGLSEEAIHREVVPIRSLCELYEVPLDYRHFEGNPVLHLLGEAKHHDLVVVARRQKRWDSYFDPDVALRLAARAPCSVLVLTVHEEA